MTTKQVWLVPVTPAQRWVLLNLSHADSQKISAKESKAYRRFMRALGLSAIRDALRANRDRGVSAAMVNSDAPALFELTAETLDYVLGIAEKVDRKPVDEDIVGDLFDLLADLKADRDVEYPDCVRYDAAAESWDPPAEPKDEPAEAPPAPLEAPGEETTPPPAPPRQDDRPEA